jgi:hypothetical protein
MNQSSSEGPVWDGIFWRMPKWGAWEVADYATENALEEEHGEQPGDDENEERIQRQDDWRWERERD